ncbi:hypothetical protein BDR22DRAFT_805917, partial [Usnea florida]
IGFSGLYPFHFSPSEIVSHEQQLSEYSQWFKVHDFAKKYLDTGAEGGVPPGADWVRKRSQNKALLDLMSECLAGLKSGEEVRRIWPFPT